MHKTTVVLPSARAIRHEQLKIESNTLFLPNFITINEFISKLCIVKGFKSIDEDRRVLLLLEASDFNSFSTLKIQRNFFTFTKNSAYIFNFFSELSAELYDMDNLESADIYGEYEEHLSILKELYKRYEKLCFEQKVLDKIFLPKLYEFNEAYINLHKQIEINIDGHLTNFEFELLQKCCKFSSVKLIFSTSKFNIKMQNKFLDMGIKLEKGYNYTISLNTKEILCKELRVKNKDIVCESFSESVLQIAFIKQKLYESIKDGYKAQNIAVILPNESMAQKLKSFDIKSNFNFAMGESFSHSMLYKKLNASTKLLNQKTQENFARIESMGDEAYIELAPNWHKNILEFDLIEFLQNYKNSFTNKAEIKIFDEELYSFSKILRYLTNMSVKSVLNLFLQRLSLRSLDDIMGGKVTVMGVLESRSVEFDVAIIVDFNDNYVPKRSNKDMFLNTNIRKMANLPTMQDRENLQKHYYDLLISKSKRVYISYVDSSQSTASRFLKELNIKKQNKYLEVDYAKVLFDISKHTTKDEEDIVLEYSFKDRELSATRLNIFLTCKRRYYYRYIKHIQRHEIPKDIPKEYEIGNLVHKALSNLYMKKNRYTSVVELKKDLDK
ncbi:MAG: PD-(D/E)XK nuclease family protein, partial [Epsilonproteobacteria bacterium]|nr:PD-(D/E)XK nuclease family protein [Campylobacterota bacterium]